MASGPPARCCDYSARSRDEYVPMNTVAWFHPFAGIAGDMALGALLDAGADIGYVYKVLAELPIDGFNLEARSVHRGGLTATLADVRTADQAHHRHYVEIVQMLDSASLPTRVKQRSLLVFARLAEVEGALHGVTPAEVEFHEVGSLDAVVDIVGTCAALESLGVDEVMSGPVALGHGTVNAAHGPLPNPAPAVAALLVGKPVVGRDIASELTTPTGAALLAALATHWGAMPSMQLVATGLGAGQRDPIDRANVTQVMIGTRGGSQSEMLTVLEANVDDATGEVLADVVARLLDAGALDAWLTPIVMKKGRPATTVHVLATGTDTAALRQLLAEHSGSLGVRSHQIERWSTERHLESVVVDGHEIAIKVTGYRAKAEFDDAARAAQASGRPVRDVIAEAEARWRLGVNGPADGSEGPPGAQRQ
jgi:uncharacterized protein (TIGR00299 family) protein